MAEWQPISSAPKDGTEIALLFEREEFILGKIRPRVRAACWSIGSSGSNWSLPYYSSSPPIAWQPLPPPPGEPAQQGESNG